MKRAGDRALAGVLAAVVLVAITVVASHLGTRASVADVDATMAAEAATSTRDSEPPTADDRGALSSGEPASPSRSLEEESAPRSDGELARRSSALGSPSGEIRPFTLRVVDAERGFDLVDVEVRLCARSSGCEIPIDDDTLLVASGRSPLVVRAQKAWGSTLSLLASAAGYVPVVRSIETGSGGEREVELRRGAALEVAVRGRPGHKRADVRLTPLDRIRRGATDAIARERSGLRATELGESPRARQYSLVLQLLSACEENGPVVDVSLLRALESCQPSRKLALTSIDRVAFDGVEPGDCFVELLTRKDESVGAAIVHVTLDARNEVVLDWRDVQRTETVAVSGRIVFDDGWFESVVPPRSCQVTFRPVEQLPSRFVGGRSREISIEPRLLPGTRGVYPFDVIRLLPGPYEVSVAAAPVNAPFEIALGAAQSRHRIEVGESGSDELEIRVAPPAELELSAVDAETGVPVDWPSFRCGADDGDGGVESKRMVLSNGRVLNDSSNGRTRFRLPAGTVIASASAAKYAQQVDRVELQPGRNEHVFRLRPAAAFVVTLTADGARPAWSDDARIVLEPADGARQEGPMILARTPFSLGSPESTELHAVWLPGRWHVAVLGVPGFECIAPVDVELVRGQETHVEIPMRRVR